MTSKESSALKGLTLFSVKLIDMANLGMKLGLVSIGIGAVQISLSVNKSPNANDTVFDLGVTLGYVASVLMVVSVAGQFLSYYRKVHDKEG